jgi:acyl carrier protein phosphodiesterase
MNFLAHLYLSGNNPKIMVGNFLGDFVRGRNLLDRYDADVACGIELHRSIDEFTDSHPTVSISKHRLRQKYRHYSPVIVDIFYDHFLAKDWHVYHNENLSDFAQHAYAIIKQHHEILPPEAQHMLPYMINGDWLVNYSKIEGIHKALTGMSRRTRFDSKMDESVGELRDYYSDFQVEFENFFPELKKFADAFIANNNSQ